MILIFDCFETFAGGALCCDKEETLELKYFSLDHTPEMFCKQHEEILNDIRMGNCL